MKETQNISAKITFHGVICISAFVLLFLTILFYTQSVMYKDQEIAAILASIYLLMGIYTGRYIAQLWAHKNKPIPNRLFILLVITITTCMIWLFLHAEFRFDDRTFLNLLLIALPSFVLSLAIGMFIKLIRTTIKNQLQTAKAQVEHSKSELSLLQSQLSPHFLFNTLNNIYGISISHHEKIPPLLLKLSDLLRYSVYDAKELFVPLKSEITYLKHYIDFEQIRIGEKLVLNTSIEDVTDSEIKIAPMLLIVFIENAFKHSKNTAAKEIFIDITLKTEGDSIFFFIKNSHSNSKEENNMMNKNSGLGLVNVKKRLDLLYANVYDLKIQSDEGFYYVMLQLKVKSYE